MELTGVKSFQSGELLFFGTSRNEYFMLFNVSFCVGGMGVVWMFEVWEYLYRGVLIDCLTRLPADFQIYSYASST